MAENYVTEGLKFIGDWSKTFYEKNKAHIFTGLGITGTIATGVLSAKDGMKAARHIDEESRKIGRELTFKEKLQISWKDYIDAGLMCSLACFSEFKSDQINTRTIADRTALLIASEKAYEKLVTKTREVLGEKKATQVKDEMVKEESVKHMSSEGFDKAPRIGNGDLFPFMDNYSKILFWSNPDYIDLQVMKLQNRMRDLPPRGTVNDYNDKMIGVPYSDWLEMIGVPAAERNTPERRNMGWNRGFDEKGEDDDPIDYTRTTVEYSPGFAVCVIDWVKDPTDMKLGRMIKANGW